MRSRTSVRLSHTQIQAKSLREVATSQDGVLICGTVDEANGPGLSQSLERGLAVLGAFTPDRPTLGISDLARELALTRSTTYRYVATLAALGFLKQDDVTRRYRLGPRVLDLGFSVLGSLELRDIAAPHLRRLTDVTGHTSNLAIRDDTDVILVDRIRGKPGRYHHLEFTLHVGSRIPAYCSATGKALLAFLPQPDLDRIVERIDLVQRGPKTLTSKKALLAQLEQVRRTGLATNDEELESALRSIAAPVRSRSGEVVAAVNVAIPWSPAAMSELVKKVGPTVLATAHEIATQVI
jgi:IclR family transcriptional regulator, pca regulon regulatory protein